MDPIVQLTQWRQGLAGRQLSQHLAVWADAEPALAPFRGDVARLFRFFRTPPSPERDAVFCALIRQARGDQFAGLVVLEALLPGLKTLIGSIPVAAPDREQLLASLLDNAWERIVSYPVDRRPARVAANLLLDIRKAAVRELDAQRRPPRWARLSPVEPAPPFCTTNTGVLEKATAAGAISGDEAELIAQTRIDGVALPTLAELLGIPYITVYQRRSRAERRLLLHLQGRRPVKKRPLKRHMCSARPAALEAADSASGGAST